MKPESIATDRKEILKNALLKIAQLQTRLKKTEDRQSEPIAIIGAGCRLPGGVHDLDSFWQVLHNGVNTVSEIPAERWKVDAYFDPNPDAVGKMYTRYGSFLNQVDEFDAPFFNIVPREAEDLDPQQRLLLEVSWEALEMSGQGPENVIGSNTGVYIGMTTCDYALLQCKTTSTDYINTYFGTGTANSIASGRIAYFLGLRGPCMTVDTACSSSLVALHLACQSLYSGENRMALAGGVSLILAPDSQIVACKGKMLAPDGRCKTFDAAADGYGRGEGCGMVVLKRFSDALADGDHILGLIRGSAVNQDGKSAGLTAPNGIAQEEVIRKALMNARVAAEDVCYIETHGTGTVLGDPIEIQALGEVFGAGRPKGNPLLVGSVKTNMGHLEAAAGITGLIKILLAFQHREIPPHLNFKTPNPYIPWDQLPIKVATSSTPFPEKYPDPIVGLSSFGFSGTNAHFILQAPPAETQDVAIPSTLNLLTVSAKTPKALENLAGSYVQFMAQQTSLPLDDVCYTANAGRSHFGHRIAVVGNSKEELRFGLKSFIESQPNPAVYFGEATAKNPPAVAFLFSGHTAQTVGMGHTLFKTQPVFRSTLENCHDASSRYLTKPLLELLYPSPEKRLETEGLVNHSGDSLPLLFAVEYALFQLLKSWGVEPAAVTGHGFGEYAAACAAGVLTIDDAFQLVCELSRCIKQLQPGIYSASISVDATKVASMIDDLASTVRISEINSPTDTVISGLENDLAIVLDRLKAEGVGMNKRVVPDVFQFNMTMPMLADFEKIAAKIRCNNPRIDLISTCDGKLISGEFFDGSKYWCRQAHEPVQFMTAMQTLYEKGYRLFVKIGPGSDLLDAAARTVDDPKCIWIPTLHTGHNDHAQLTDTLARLYVNGASISWTGVASNARHHRLRLPTYPFQRSKYWKASTFPKVDGINGSARNTLTETYPEDLDGSLYRLEWQQDELSETSNLPEKLHKKTPGHWIVFCDHTGIGRRLAELLENFSESVIKVYPSDAFGLTRNDTLNISDENGEYFSQFIGNIFTSQNNGFRGIIYCWGMNFTPCDHIDVSILNQSHQVSIGSLLHLVRALSRTKATPPPKLWIATSNTQPVKVDEGPVSIMQAPLWGIGRVMDTETPELFGGCVDFSSEPTDSELRLFIHDLLNPSPEIQFAYRGDQRHLARLMRQALPKQEEKRPLFDPDASYLITGGMGGIGLTLAKYMSEQGARNIVLMGRKGLHPSARETVDTLTASGTNIVIAKGDVSKKEDVTDVLSQISETLPPLRGIIHTAGVLHDGLLLKLNWSDFSDVMAPKVAGAWYLHALTKELPLDFFVLCSSMASITGSPGQANYAAANAFLDALTHYRRALGLKTMCINWGIWGDVGMTKTLGNREAEKRAAAGVIDIKPDKGAQILGKLINSDLSQIAVFPILWKKFFRQFEPDTMPTLLTTLYREVSGQPGGLPEPLDQETLFLPKKIYGAPHNMRQDLLFKHIRQRVVEVLKLDVSQPMDFQRGLTDIGMDSLMAVELRNILQNDIKQPIPASVIFEYPTVKEMSEYILSKFFTAGDQPTSSGNVINEKTGNAGDDDLLNMSDDDAELSLLEELKRSGY